MKGFLFPFVTVRPGKVYLYKNSSSRPEISHHIQLQKP